MWWLILFCFGQNPGSPPYLPAICRLLQRKCCDDKKEENNLHRASYINAKTRGRQRRREGKDAKKAKTRSKSLNPSIRQYANSSISLGAHHLNKALAHVNPLPKAARQTRSPSLILPCSQASQSAMGMDAAVVLPYFWILLYTWSSRS